LKIDEEITECITQFLKNPLKLSILSGESENWASFLALLHILLVKYDVKKSHLVLGQERLSGKTILKNNLKISKKIDFPMKIIQSAYSETIASETPILDHDLIVQIVSHKPPERIMVYSKEDSNWNKIEYVIRTNLNTRTSGRILEYPDCCIAEMIKHISNSYEIAYQIYQKDIENGNISTLDGDKLTKFLKETSWDYDQPYILFHTWSFRKYQNNAFNKFPFCFHQPCANCINQKNSPTEILNSKYADFAKKNFPLLYNTIIKEGRKKYQLGVKINAEDKKILEKCDFEEGMEVTDINVTLTDDM